MKTVFIQENVSKLVIIAGVLLLAVALSGCASQKVRADHDEIAQARANARPISMSCVGTQIRRRCRTDQQFMQKPSIEVHAAPSPMSGKKR